MLVVVMLLILLDEACDSDEGRAAKVFLVNARRSFDTILILLSSMLFIYFLIFTINDIRDDRCYSVIVHGQSLAFFFPPTSSRSLSLTYFTVARNTTPLSTIFHQAAYRIPTMFIRKRTERNKDFSRYLGFRSGSLFIVSPEEGQPRRRSRYGKCT